MDEDIPRKRCPRCKANLPATEEFFVRRTPPRKTLNSWCRWCNREAQLASQRTEAGKKRKREYNQRPEARAERRAYNQRPDVKERAAARKRTPLGKLRDRRTVLRRYVRQGKKPLKKWKDLLADVEWKIAQLRSGVT